MELKVVCQCGQKYAFEAEPVDGRMPYTVSCPVCKTDGTATANTLLAQYQPPPMRTATMPPPPPPMSGGLRINQQTAPMEEAALAPVIAPIAPRVPASTATGQFNLGLGIVGALVGAVVGAGLLLGFDYYAGFRFPLTGVVVGGLSGYLGRLLGKGGNPMLGGIAAGFSALATAATLFLIYGSIPTICILSIVISVTFAYRIGSKF